MNSHISSRKSAARSVLVPDEYRPGILDEMRAGKDWLDNPEHRAFVRDALLGMVEEGIRRCSSQMQAAIDVGEAPDPRWMSEYRQSIALAARIVGVGALVPAAKPQEEPEEIRADPGAADEAARADVLRSLEVL